MDEAAAERIRKARGEKVRSPARLPRVSSLFTPLPGRVCPTSIHCRAAKQGGKRHRQGGASTRGEQWQRQRRREARRRRREVRQAVRRGISNVLDRGMGIKWMGGFSPGWTGRRSAGSGHGTGRVCLLLSGALVSVGYLVHDSCFSFAAAPAAASFLSSIFIQWESEYHDWTRDWRGQTGKQDVVDLLPRTNDEPHGLLHCIHAG